MLEHQQSHTDNYRFRCSTCNKGFTRQSYYRDHKCPAAGNETGAEGGTEEAEGDEDAGEPVAEEKDGEDDGRGSRITRKSKRARTGGDDTEEEDCSEDSQHRVDTRREEEGVERRSDEGCRAAIVNAEEQMEREEDHDGVDNGGDALAQIQSNDQIGLQQPCL